MMGDSELCIVSVVNLILFNRLRIVSDIYYLLYVCGIVIGLSQGYIVFFGRKPLVGKMDEFVPCDVIKFLLLDIVDSIQRSVL